MQANEYLRELYLDWANNYLTVVGFASDHGISIPLAEKLLVIGRELHEQYVEEQQAGR